ncbi:hypothetical protein PR202_gb02906 [Eleusine coracana subsp. coracana]|uniref:Uncharacterized protein n=1 Tax=Eleusine coracana subsp. coracana TaxID=191504 RepID=A0AAV5E0H5_ELECO|nr:hypothetical protein PR202_gb02906 [Eleusine coracana subsp. coracana]
MSTQAEARRLMVATSIGAEGPSNDVVVEGNGSFSAKEEMTMATSTGQGGQQVTMPMTTTDSRSTNPGNSPGIGNKGKINN